MSTVKNMSDFKQKVFKVAANIPKGRLLTYGQVAKRAGSPRASRAVGSILATNYDPKIYCHRVIRSDGKIGNYNRGGEAAKRKILARELGVESSKLSAKVLLSKAG
jgi:O-6-methylguanine DNA methyltransferase